jgi:hypothetical protein
MKLRGSKSEDERYGQQVLQAVADSDRSRLIGTRIGNEPLVYGSLQETAELPSARPMEDKPKPTEEVFFYRLHLIFRRSLADAIY